MGNLMSAQRELLPPRAVIREVGPRDGLQGERPVAPAERARLIGSLIAAGLVRIEAVSFVSPKHVPAMDGAAEVLAVLGERPGVSITALVPNLRGAELALASGVDELTVTVSASPTYNQHNVHMSVDASLEAIAAICALADGARARPASGTRDGAGIPVDAVVSCAFGSPYEGDIAPGAIARLVERLRGAGAAAITLADTTGMATPRVLAEALEAVTGEIGLHLHETRGTGVLNLYAALTMGVTRFDTSVGGLGGSPFAAGAAGNVATEEAVALLDDLGVETGVSVEAVIAAAHLAAELVGHPVPSGVAKVGPRTRLD
jgi:hydroxymethylglutaryl-CoA lyase